MLDITVEKVCRNLRVEVESPKIKALSIINQIFIVYVVYCITRRIVKKI